MVPTGWTDVLEAVPSTSGNTTLHQSGIALDCDPADNLIMRAYRLMEADYKLPALDIYLCKCVPSGAGLGGGSADAASMLRLINDMAHLHISDERLAEYAARLGADCPFFIYNSAMMCEGIGTDTYRIDVPQLAGMWVAIAKPDVHISTAEAYRGTVPHKPKRGIRDILNMPMCEWREWLHNDFEDSLSEKYPYIKEVKEHLYSCGAIYASLSGSGASVYGLFTDEVCARAAIERLPMEQKIVVRLPVNP